MIVRFHSRGRKRAARTPESLVLSAVLKVLRYDRRVAWACRMNSGAVKMENRFVRFGTSGLPDVIGFTTDGRFLAIECKAEKGKLTENQRQFLRRAMESGCLAGVARNAAEALEILDGRLLGRL